MKRYFIIFILAFFALSLNAKNIELIGTWQGNDEDSKNNFGILRISKNHLSFGQELHNKICKTRYKLFDRYKSNSYPNDLKDKKGSYAIYKLRLSKKACLGNEFYYQLALNVENNEVLAYLVTYDEDGNFVSIADFKKISDNPDFNNN